MIFHEVAILKSKQKKAKQKRMQKKTEKNKTKQPIVIIQAISL